MSLSKDKLIFDEADLANSDQVGSHIIGTGGVKVTSTTVGGKEALDVAIQSIILRSEFAEDAAHVDGDIGQFVLAVRQDTLASSTSADGDYAAFKVSALGELYTADLAARTSLASIDSSLDAIEVDVAAIEAEAIAINAELDAQTALLTTLDANVDLIEAHTLAIKNQTDQFTFDAGRLNVLADIDLESDVADDAPDTENPLKVGSRAVDGLLAAISASGDKANVISDMYRRVYVNDAPNVGFKVSAESVTTIAAQLVAAALLGRKRIAIQNLGNQPIFIGFDGTVTSANGLRVSAGAYLELPFGEDLDVFAIAGAGTQSIRVVEIG